MPAGVVDQALKDLEAQITLTQVGVTVLFRSLWVTGIVEMEATGLVGAEKLLSPLKEGLVACLGVDRVASSKRVAGIHAETKPASAVGPLDNC